MRLKFAKMHGLGNDFVVLDLITQHFEATAPQIRAWADRHTGIGFDQLLLVRPPSNPDADFRYQIFNNDGSEVEQCGNGARCFAKFVIHAGLTVKRTLTIETLGGSIATEIVGDIGPKESMVQVDMGIPRTDPGAIPFVADAPSLSYPIDIGDESVEVTPVSIGNPHAVILVENIAEAPVGRVAAALQSHPRFPESVNVGFLQVVDRGFARLRVVERGVGETRACGTGACAAVAAGRLHGLLDDRVKVSLPGGKVRVMWHGENTPVRMTGPAVLVYEGYFDV